MRKSFHTLFYSKYRVCHHKHGLDVLSKNFLWFHNCKFYKKTSSHTVVSGFTAISPSCHSTSFHSTSRHDSQLSNLNILVVSSNVKCQHFILATGMNLVSKLVQVRDVAHTKLCSLSLGEMCKKQHPWLYNERCSLRFLLTYWLMLRVKWLKLSSGADLTHLKTPLLWNLGHFLSPGWQSTASWDSEGWGRCWPDARDSPGTWGE